MRKLLVGAMLAGAICLSGLAPSALAQKEKDKKAPPKSSKTGTVYINEGKDGKFRFTIYDGDDKFIAQSALSGYLTEKDAKAAVETLKDVLAKATVVKGKVAEKDKEKGKTKPSDKK